MDLSSASHDVVQQGLEEKESIVDPFLVEALQNPRHRLTILRMEIDIQKFLQSVDQQLFEFQHFPTSYLRLAAHRVAQHYGLQTMVQDTGIDGQGRILVRKTGEGKNPPVRLSEIPAKQLEIEKPGHIKIATRPRPNKASGDAGNDCGSRRNSVRSVEERKEEYDRARARIFSSPSSTDSDELLSQAPKDGKNIFLSSDEAEGFRISMNDVGMTSRVAIFRDREKDRSDPDYDRSYQRYRYIRSGPVNQTNNLDPFTMQKIQPPFVQFDNGYSALGHMPRSQAVYGYGHPSKAVMSSNSHFCAPGLNQTFSDVGYVHWPSAAIMYANNFVQAPFCQQPLSFDYSQNH